jgi:hypothetical protein
MTLNRLNVLCALISFVASCIWLAMGQVPSGLIWLACSLGWLTLGIIRRGSSIHEPHPMRRIANRLSRLLLWS